MTTTPPLPPPTSSAKTRSLAEMMAEARARLATMEISCRELLDGQPPPIASAAGGSVVSMGSASSPRSVSSSVLASSSTMTTTKAGDPPTELLALEVEALRRRVGALVRAREDEDLVFGRAMAYAAAKGTANAVLHGLFDQASAGKAPVLAHWHATGVLPTRDGLKHWRLDPRTIRNEAGATLLHVAVDKSMALEKLKVTLVELCVDTMGFDVNVRDAFGRAPLHLAAMGGYTEVCRALLARGADPMSRDRAGHTPLASVRTLSRPPEEVVQLLAAAESERARQYRAPSNRLPRTTAIASGLFLRSLTRFARPDIAEAFAWQVETLLAALLRDKDSDSVPLDEIAWARMPLLFMVDAESRAVRLARLDHIFSKNMYGDVEFIDALQIEAAAYGLSLVTPESSPAIALAGASWVGFILKLIHCFRLEMATPSTTPMTNSSLLGSLTNGSEALNSRTPPPSPPAETPHTSNSVRSPIYAEQLSSGSRQAWHYAVLFKPSTHALPGTVCVQRDAEIVVCSDDVSRFFPLDDRLLINGVEYHGVDFDAATRQLRIDRAYEGTTASDLKVYVAGSHSSLIPPYIATKRIWEREPGNKYEDHMSHEQELFQDYQFLDPDSEYEVAVKVGPVPTAREARSLVEEWRSQTRKLFETKTCSSGSPACAYYCPQRNGHSLCVETMAAVGRDLAKKRLGRPTFSKQLKPRASLQKYQDLFLGKSPWPGSPSSAPPRLALEAVVDAKAIGEFDLS